jgi:outer membrane protein OmpA-like peptidoglycan-associated protein
MLRFSYNILFIFLLAAALLFSSCRTTEELTEPEPAPEVTGEVVEDVAHEDIYGDEEEVVVDEPDYVESLGTINFGFDLYSITDRAARTLAQNVVTLKDNPDVRVRIDAYTDHVGGDQYNLRLSVRRANAVADFYIRNGIAENRIDRRGLGKAPVQCAAHERDRDTPGCERNRRAESHPINP